MALNYNIKGKDVSGGTSDTTELVSPDKTIVLTSLTITNVHASSDATVTLLMQNDPVSGSTSTYNIIKSVAIPAKSTLLLDNPNMLKIPVSYGLYITVGSSDTVDVMMVKIR